MTGEYVKFFVKENLKLTLNTPGLEMNSMKMGKKVHFTAS